MEEYCLAWNPDRLGDCASSEIHHPNWRSAGLLASTVIETKRPLVKVHHTTTALIMPTSKNLGQSHEINRQLLINTMINKPLNLVLVELAETST